MHQINQCSNLIDRAGHFIYSPLYRIQPERTAKNWGLQNRLLTSNDRKVFSEPASRADNGYNTTAQRSSVIQV